MGAKVQSSKMRSLLLMLLLGACGAQNPPENVPEDAREDTADSPEADAAEIDAVEVDADEVDAPESDAPVTAWADVLAVEVQGDGLSVTLRSPDTGCTQYANWWEVVTEDGALLYRRILGHSHVDEQPFTRSGGPLASDASLVVRAHMEPGGYGGVAFRGTLNAGFVAAPDIDADFAAELGREAPLPTGCAF